MPNITLDSPFSSLGVKTKYATSSLIHELNEEDHEAFLHEPTIADLLKVDIEKKYYHDFGGQYLGVAFLNKNRTSVKTLHALRSKLLEHGFTAKDGLFLYFGTKKYYVDDIMKKQSISEEKATEYIDIAISMKWIKVLPG